MKYIWYYHAKLEASADTKVFILNKNKELLTYYNSEPNHNWIDHTGFDRSSKSDAEKDLDFVSVISNECIDNYISQSIKYCQ